MSSQTSTYVTSQCSPDDDKPDDITFAVEIKCLIRQKLPSLNNLSSSHVIRPFVPHQPEESRNSMTDDEKLIHRSAWRAVALVLYTLPGIEATTIHQIREQNLNYGDFWRTHWIVYKANSAVPPYLSFEDGDPDRPVLDATTPDFDKFVWIPLEICSPKLSWTQRDRALENIGKVCDALTQRLGAVANHSCEAHVHVGRDDGLFFSLGSMKRLATLLWLSEPILRSVKNPKSRNFDHTFTWSLPWRQHSRIALALDSHRNLTGGQTIDELYTGNSDDFDAFFVNLNNARHISGLPGDSSHLGDEHHRALRAIWGASNHQELGRMLCGPEQRSRRLGFNFHSLAAEDERGRNSPRTIEFRFLEGFNDKDIVSGWVQVCTGIVKLAVDGIEDARFYRMAKLLLSIPENWSMEARFVAMVHQLGLTKAAYEPLQKVIRNNHPPESANT